MRFPRAAHVQADVLSFQFVVTGVPSRFGENADPVEWSRQVALRTRNVCMLANSYAESGFVPILDNLVTERTLLDEHLRLLAERSLHLVVLAPDIEIAIERRLAEAEGMSRDDWHDAEMFRHWRNLDSELRANLTGLGLWVDTGALTTDATVDQILARREQAVVP